MAGVTRRPHFSDEGYLSQEIDYAIAEKRTKGNRFSIITLVFADGDGNVGSVPELLKRYVWKTPVTHLEGLREILKALPIKHPLPEWTR